MKKVFSVLMVCAFAISATAQWLIYDYKVSIKRIDPQYTKLSYKIDEFDARIPKGASCPDYVTGYFDSFTTANDTLTGYILMPACASCAKGSIWQEFGSAYFQPAMDGYPYIAVTAGYSPSTIVTINSNDSTDINDSFKVVKYGNEDSVILETAYAYIQRNGDKLYSNPQKSHFGSKSAQIDAKLTWKTPINVDAARFGKGAGARLSSVYCTNEAGVITTYCTCREWLDPASAYPSIIAKWYALPTHARPVKEAWMVLTYDIFTWIGTENNTVVVPGGNSTVIYPPVNNLPIDACCTPKGLTYGLVGYQTKVGSISHAGFGKLTTTTTSGSTTVGFCGSAVVNPTSCTAVNTITGTITGLFEVIGFCSEQPQWDICYYFKEDSWNGRKPSNKDVAPVCGNWTLKLNQSDSKNYGGTFATAEARVLDKLHCSPISSWRTELRENFIYNATDASSVDNYSY